MRIRTTNNRLIGFAYKPGSAEQAELLAEGKSEEQAADHQHFNVTPEGVDVPDRAGAYAVNLYSTQIEAMGNEARAVEAPVEPVVDSDGSFTNGSDAGVDISGEEEVSVPKVLCLKCTPVVQFAGKTNAAAKGKLTRHTRLEHETNP